MSTWTNENQPSTTSFYHHFIGVHVFASQLNYDQILFRNGTAIINEKFRVLVDHAGYIDEHNFIIYCCFEDKKHRDNFLKYLNGIIKNSEISKIRLLDKDSNKIIILEDFIVIESSWYSSIDIVGLKSRRVICR